MLQLRDGKTWERADAPGVNTGLLASAAGRLLAFRRSSEVFYSRRAGETNWTMHLLPWTSSSERITYSVGVAFGQNTFLLTHGLGFILQSDPLIESAPQLTQPVSEAVADPAGTVTLRTFVLGSSPFQYQWRRHGTNISGAVFSTLTLPARQAADGTITVTVTNKAGGVESPPARIYPAEPAKLQMEGDGSALRVFGTPGARYRIEVSDELAEALKWFSVSSVEIPSSGAPMRVLTGWQSYASPTRFFRAVNQP